MKYKFDILIRVLGIQEEKEETRISSGQRLWEFLY